MVVVPETNRKEEQYRERYVAREARLKKWMKILS